MRIKPFTAVYCQPADDVTGPSVTLTSTRSIEVEEINLESLAGEPAVRFRQRGDDFWCLAEDVMLSPESDRDFEILSQIAELID